MFSTKKALRHIEIKEEPRKTCPNDDLDQNHIVLRGLQLQAMGQLQPPNLCWGLCHVSSFLILSWLYQGSLGTMPAPNLHKPFHASEVSTTQQMPRVLASSCTIHRSCSAYPATLGYGVQQLRSHLETVENRGFLPSVQNKLQQETSRL